jgi:uncharacterized protein YcbK (DUF882 family)
MKKYQQSMPCSHQAVDSNPPRQGTLPSQGGGYLTRRTFVKFGAVAALGGVLPRAAFGLSKNFSVEEKSLAFYNTHTSEKLKAVYWAEGNYVDDSLREINYVLRDPRNDEVHDIDPRLLDLIFAIGKEIDATQPFHVISGYRSAQTNAFLRARSAGVAEHSLHRVGKAIDIRSPGRPLRALQKAALALKGGGVGYYPKSDFVHVDTGRVRYW